MGIEDTFPYPVPEYGAEPYWEAANRGELRMQRCSKWRIRAILV